MINLVIFVYRDSGFTWKIRIMEKCFQCKKQAIGIKIKKAALKNDVVKKLFNVDEIYSF